MNAKNEETGAEGIYDWWSRHPGALDILYDVAFLGRELTIRRQAVETLNPTPGERILDVECGNGNSFTTLRNALGSNGTLVGFDVSRGMGPATGHAADGRTLTRLSTRHLFAFAWQDDHGPDAFYRLE